MPVNPQNHVPIYEQIVEHICGAVAAGVYRAGDVLPSIRALALDLTVNPNTVQRAYQELERQGLVHTRKGLGMFVAKDGHETARNKSEAAVHARFVQGLEVAQMADIPLERIQTLFQKAVDDACGGSKKADTANENTPTDSEDES